MLIKFSKYDYNNTVTVLRAFEVLRVKMVKTCVAIRNSVCVQPNSLTRGRIRKAVDHSFMQRAKNLGI